LPPLALEQVCRNLDRPLHAALPLFELALLLVCLDHVASIIVNANHGIM